MLKSFISNSRKQSRLLPSWLISVILLFAGFCFMEKKVCPKCKVEKELADYNKHHGTKDGLQCYCRKCENAGKNIRDAAKREKKITEKLSNRIDLPDEKWLPVVGYEGHYEVSNMGRVYSLKFGTIMFQSKRKFGIRTVKLTDSNVIIKGWRIHRLVGIAFIPNPQNKPEIDHKDNDPSNNKADNLQWATRSEQIRWAYERGRDRKGGDVNLNAKLSNDEVRRMRSLHKSGTKYSELKKIYSHISESTLSAVLNGERYKNV